MKDKIFLTGNPGIGKTTIIVKSIDGIKSAGGFYTREIRESGERVGFEIVTLITGKTGILAHRDFNTIYRVGKYGVNVEVFENLIDVEMEEAFKRANLIVIDEIGRMELYSEKFKKMINKILESDFKILGVIQKKQKEFIKKVRRMKDAQIFEVSPENREKILSYVKEWIRHIFNIV